MNVFNRVVMLLLGLIALVFGIIVLLLLYKVVTPASVSPGGVLLQQWQFFSQLQGASATTATLIAVILAVVGLVVFVLEVIPHRREPAQFVVKQDGLGKVTVARTSVRDLVKHEASMMPDVMDTRQEVGTSRDGLRVHVQTALSPQADAPEVGKALQENIQQAIQRHIGLPVSEVRVATQIEPLNGHQQKKRVR